MSSPEKRAQRSKSGASDAFEAAGRKQVTPATPDQASTQTKHAESSCAFGPEITISFLGRKQRQVIDAELLFNARYAIHHFLEPFFAKELMLLLFEIFAQCVVLVWVYDLAQSWKHPRDGKATVIGEFPNTGEREFTPPDLAEQLDWVLVLDNSAKDYSQPGEVQYRSSRRDEAHF